MGSDHVALGQAQELGKAADITKLGSGGECEFTFVITLPLRQSLNMEQRDLHPNTSKRH